MMTSQEYVQCLTVRLTNLHQRVFFSPQLVSADTCQFNFRGSDSLSVATPTSLAPPPAERTDGIGDSRPPSFQ